jgi:hypothetical protein
MKDEHSELMSRVEKKKRDLELAVERIKGNHSGVMTEEAHLIKRNLDYIKEILKNRVENLSEKTIKELEEWLPQD